MYNAEELVRPLLTRYLNVALERWGLDVEYYHSIAAASMYAGVDEKRTYPTTPDRLIRILLDEVIDGFAINNTVSFLSQYGKPFTVRTTEQLNVYDKLVVITVDQGRVPLVVTQPLVQLISGSVIYCYSAKVLV